MCATNYPNMWEAGFVKSHFIVIIKLVKFTKSPKKPIIMAASNARWARETVSSLIISFVCISSAVYALL